MSIEIWQRLCEVAGTNVHRVKCSLEIVDKCFLQASTIGESRIVEHESCLSMLFIIGIVSGNFSFCFVTGVHTIKIACPLGLEIVVGSCGSGGDSRNVCSFQLIHCIDGVIMIVERSAEGKANCSNESVVLLGEQDEMLGDNWHGLLKNRRILYANIRDQDTNPYLIVWVTIVSNLLQTKSLEGGIAQSKRVCAIYFRITEADNSDDGDMGHLRLANPIIFVADTTLSISLSWQFIEV